MKPCSEPNCPELLEIGGPAKCKKHTAERKRGKPGRIGRAAGGYDAAWNRLRLMKLAANPWCEIKNVCRDSPLIFQVATEVDHIEPIAKRPELRLVWSNLQSACKPCHSAKTLREINTGGVVDP